jgi:S-adenosylmethionine decarboxylase
MAQYTAIARRDMAMDATAEEAAENAPRRWQGIDGGQESFVEAIIEKAGLEKAGLEKDAVESAGAYLLIDLWNAHRLDDLAVAERALREAATAAGATIQNVHLHRFSPNGGIWGVIVLAEAHIGITTWPERHHVALEVSMGGGCDPYRAITVLWREFRAGLAQVREQKRGVVQ